MARSRWSRITFSTTPRPAPTHSSVAESLEPVAPRSGTGPEAMGGIPVESSTGSCGAGKEADRPLRVRARPVPTGRTDSRARPHWSHPMPDPAWTARPEPRPTRTARRGATAEHPVTSLPPVEVRVGPGATAAGRRRAREARAATEGRARPPGRGRVGTAEGVAMPSSPVRATWEREAPEATAAGPGTPRRGRGAMEEGGATGASLPPAVWRVRAGPRPSAPPGVEVPGEAETPMGRAEPAAPPERWRRAPMGTKVGPARTAAGESAWRVGHVSHVPGPPSTVPRRRKRLLPSCRRGREAASFLTGSPLTDRS